MVIDHELIQTVANCPVRCNLGQDGDLSFSDDGIQNFDEKTGIFEVSTSDWSKDALELSLTLTCVSTKSQSLIGTAFNTFDLRYQDFCRTAELTLPAITPEQL